jgi:putative membrane protein
MRREHWIYAGFGIILVLLIVTYVYDDSLWGPCKGWKSSQERGPHSGMHRRGQFFGLGFYGFGLLFWVLVIFFVVIVFLNSTKKEEALDILNKRYAQGKISREEYTQMKEELGK